MIRFGTSGWRGLISEDFTFANIRKIAAAIATHVKENPDFGASSPDYLQKRPGGPPNPPEVAIGFDGRFLSPEAAQEAAGVLAAQGIRVLLSNSEIPTPAVACAVTAKKLVGGLMITASHNSARYNGVKWMPFWGGQAPQEVTGELERRVELSGEHSIKILGSDPALRRSWIEPADFEALYVKQILSLLDVKAIKKARLKIGYDAMHGAGRLVFKPLASELGIETVALRDSRDVLFGGTPPEPSGGNLAELSQAVVRRRLDLGLASDGDADRFGIVDADGQWIAPDLVLGLVFDHLTSRRGQRGKAARSIMTSHFVDAVAKSHGLETRETPVGFKHIGELLRTGQYLLGGEESGGLSIAGHVPNKDGLLACLLVAEIAAYERKPLKNVLAALFKRVGHFHQKRLSIPFDGLRQSEEVMESLRSKPPLEIAGAAVWRIDETDGFKFILKDGSWLGLRVSGTGAYFRLYAEAQDPHRLEALVRCGRDLLKAGRYARAS